MLTNAQKKALKAELEQFGFGVDGVSLYETMTNPQYNGDITLFYSVVEYKTRPELAARTKLKFQSMLKGIKYLHDKLKLPQPTINVLVCDTLQRHNYANEAEFNTSIADKKQQLAEVLGIPEVAGEGGDVKYTVEEETFNLKVKHWDKLLSINLRVIIDDIRKKLDQAIEKLGNEALEKFCDDKFLFGKESGLLSAEIAQLKAALMEHSGNKNVTQAGLVTLGPDIALSAMQFIKHLLHDKTGAKWTLDGQAKAYGAQKLEMLSHEACNGQGLSIFKNGILYVIEELYALAQNPSAYIYGAGIVTMHAGHPYFALQKVFQDPGLADKKPVSFLASIEFNDMTEEKLKAAQEKFNRALLNPPRPESQPIKIPAPMAGESSASGARSHGSSRASSFGSDNGARELSISPPEPHLEPHPSLLRSQSNSGHNSDSDSGDSSHSNHSDNSSKSNNSNKSKRSSSSSRNNDVSILEATVMLLRKTEPKSHNSIIDEAARLYEKNHLNPSKEIVQAAVTAATTSASGHSATTATQSTMLLSQRSRSSSPPKDSNGVTGAPASPPAQDKAPRADIHPATPPKSPPPKASVIQL